MRPNMIVRIGIKTGTVVRGKLLNSILSGNLKSPVLIKIERGPLKGNKLSCQASESNGRVNISCQKLITKHEEYKINASILSEDGSLGLIGAKLPSDGSKFVRDSSSDALKIALSETAKKITSRFKGTTSKILSKLSGKIAQTTKDQIVKDQTIYIESGKSILIHFNRRFKL